MADTNFFLSYFLLVRKTCILSKRILTVVTFGRDTVMMCGGKNSSALIQTRHDHHDKSQDISLVLLLESTNAHVQPLELFCQRKDENFYIEMRGYLYGSTGRDQPTDTFDHSKKSANAKTKTYESTNGYTRPLEKAFQRRRTSISGRPVTTGNLSTSPMKENCGYLRPDLNTIPV
ncbi:unnamed protein product [Pocillopora meandrina]|uniref:Uncharacterized protein n=1 Tax=Pocillopora meandrina TaxID=46732 RepID=A0AAU9VSW4_9CNID|nr:unnamed protein product [Pocillopora meandrina]